MTLPCGQKGAGGRKKSSRAKGDVAMGEMGLKKEGITSICWDKVSMVFSGRKKACAVRGGEQN